ncbi:MarR family winged helix-turn-helix transcriptional regulator [Paenibacillus sp. NEAU-GSW1]|uniref:MarR family winged helix-turn-helix transcriptional regulator n=1 Tax=Paenibacillus sp. NEAU-GSW1 TaxID=2682486 RepID=UPI00139D4AE6|nr:MarR family transcriptional regulator [Paenibacillus sp. NEAU-GSW1]
MKKEPVGKLISYIHRQNLKRLTKAFAPYGIGSGGQHSFLITILLNPGITQDYLTHELKFDKATTARSIKLLEQNGYIHRRPDPDDGRSHLLYPTAKATHFHPILSQILTDSNRELTQNLTSDEADQLVYLLQKLKSDPESD